MKCFSSKYRVLEFSGRSDWSRFIQRIVLGTLLLLFPLFLSSCNKDKSDSEEKTVTTAESSTLEGQIQDKYTTYQLSKKSKVNLSEDYGGPDEVVFTRSVDIQWPQHLDGVSNLPVLQDHLIILMFGQSYPDISAALDDYWMAPKTVVGAYEPRDSISLKPIRGANANFLQYELFHYVDAGGGIGASEYYSSQVITYDKRQQIILRNQDVLNNPSSTRLVEVINSEIKLINENKEGQYGYATKVPKSFKVSDKGIYFTCTADEDVIQFGYQGDELEVYIPYFKIADELKDEFKVSAGI